MNKSPRPRVSPSPRPPRSPAPSPVLTIAGSDSGGAAGLQADLKTFTALGVYGMSAVTAVTAQNSREVRAVHFLSPDFVAAQIDAVLADYRATAVKTGFIGRVELVQSIATRLAAHQVVDLVIDPVLVNHKGEGMFATAVSQAYLDHLFPLARLVMPNRAEAALLTGLPVTTLAEMETAARTLHSYGPGAVLIKGGREGDEIVDVLFDGREYTHLRTPWIETTNTHGSGDTLSAAVVAYLAQGMEMMTAVRQAHHFTNKAIATAVGWRLGGGHGPLNHLQRGQADMEPSPNPSPREGSEFLPGGGG